ncbi:MAG TPA: LysR family transcriptional regulator [Burkholderiales bacterium]|nr:LysR family transcriptional regulator [Burkholderiales bacterium]
MNRLNGIAEFVATVEHKSFSAAAHQIGMTSSGVSKAVTRLERRLGIRLLTRSTRRLSLTASGAAFYQKCRHLLLELQDAEGTVAELRRPPIGRIHVELPPALGRLYVMPRLPEFTTAYPDTQLRVVFREQHVDSFDEGLDVAVRIGGHPSTSSVALQVDAARYVTCAAPAYLRRHGVPLRPEALVEHNCLMYVSGQTGQVRDWHFTHRLRPFTIAVNGNLALSNTDGLIHAAVQAAGVVQVLDFVAARAVQQGLLKPILTEFSGQQQPIFIIYPSSRRDVPKVRAFVSFLTGLFPLSPASRAARPRTKVTTHRSRS